MGSTVFHQRIPPKRILVVEDEVVAALSIRTVLAADGHMIEIAEDGEKGLDMFQAGEYDLVITDFNPTFATGAGDLSKMAENRLLTLKGLHQTQSLSSSPF